MNWEVKTLSVRDLTREFLELEIGDSGKKSADRVLDAAKAAEVAFPRRLIDLLDDGWEVMLGDSATAHLRKKK